MKTLLVLIVLALGVFAYLKFQINGDPNSSFNQTTRYNLGHYALNRTILGMHNVGDAREWYLEGSSEVALEIVRAKGTQLDDRVMNNFLDSLKTYLGRPVILYDTEYAQSGTLSDSDIQAIAKGSRHHLVFGEPNLFVIYAQDFDRVGDAAVEPLNEYGMVVSDARLRQITAQYPEALPQYQQAVMLYEFGQQMGLPSNTQDGCLMSPTGNNPKISFSFAGAFTPTAFCDLELKQLNILKGNAQ